jgi:hypothetical protein
LRHVVPALTRQQIADLNHSHRVVGVEEAAAAPDRQQAGLLQDEGQGEREGDGQPEPEIPARREIPRRILGVRA